MATLRTCAYPGCDVAFVPIKGQRYHSRRESWRVSNRRWAAANREQKNACQRAYYATAGLFKEQASHRDQRHRAERERITHQLAALDREEQECLTLLASQIPTR